MMPGVLRFFDLGGDGFAALVLPGSGGQTLVTVNAKGEELGRLAPDRRCDGCQRPGEICGLPGRSDLHHRRQEARTLVFHPGGRVCHAGQACTNGAAYLVSGRSALRVLP